jgi:hypothetical protein
VHLVDKLLTGDPVAGTFFAHNPFPEKPPKRACVGVFEAR